MESFIAFTKPSIMVRWREEEREREKEKTQELQMNFHILFSISKTVVLASPKTQCKT